MNIGLLTSWMSYRGGGVFDVVRRIAPALQAPPEFQVSVFGLAERGSATSCADWNGVRASALPISGPSAIGYAPRLTRLLKAAKIDVLHVHGLWMFPSMASLSWAHATRRPYLITPHGMLDDWALGNGRWKKRMALWTYEERHLRGAACLQALCEAEASSFRSLGLRNPICIIPNSVSQPDDLGETDIADPENRCPTFLYLGRLHVKKGLENLLRAWRQFEGRRDLPGGRWQLVVAGWDQHGHERELRTLSADLGVTESVIFPGPQFGAAKDAIFRRAAAFVLPSVSEGLPIAVLEAWSYGLPVLMTPHCNIPEGFATGAAMPISADRDGILQGLRTFSEMTGSNRRKMSASGLRLVRQQFSPSTVNEELKGVYRWLNGAGPRPACVLMD
jgi:glycosyltransferase involved in cell wall biosynthesis